MTQEYNASSFTSSPANNISEPRHILLKKREKIDWKPDYGNSQITIFVQNQTEAVKTNETEATEESSILLKTLQQILQAGGWTVAVLIGFRIAIVPLVAVGNSNVIFVLAVAISVFLILRAIAQLIREIPLSRRTMTLPINQRRGESGIDEVDKAAQ